MIQVYSHTEAGGHAHNEDAFEVKAHPSDPSCLLCALADGQGGQAGGARAAQLACRFCIEGASAYRPAELAMQPEVWRAVLQGADHAVATDAEAGFTTLIAFAIQKDAVCGASNGDSGLLALGAGKPGAILTGRQHKDPPIGCGGAQPVGFSARLAIPWTVLILSDGAWKYAGWDRVAQAASQLSGKDLIDSLRKLAGLPRSGRLQDDFTLVVLQEDGAS
jgi:PPM family protein phosphatase